MLLMVLLLNNVHWNESLAPVFLCILVWKISFDFWVWVWKSHDKCSSHTQVASGNRYNSSSSSSKSDHIITCGIGCRVRSGCGALPRLLLAFLDPVRGSQELLGSVPGQTTQPAPPPDLPSLSEDKIFQNQNRICPHCWISTFSFGAEILESFNELE